MSFLVVTPARNEAGRLPVLAASLAGQRAGLIGRWVVVDDGSVDGTATCLPDGLPFPVTVVARHNDGGLSGGSAFSAWRFGVEHGLLLLPDAERVLKLDADIVLEPDYLEVLAHRDEALVAGVLHGEGEVVRGNHTRGGLKAYDRAAYAIVAALPTALGFDVVDEVAIRRAGLQVVVVPEARARVTRLTGSSEGLLRGRYRGGRVSRWTGYSVPYFAIRLLVHVFRKPYGAGSVAMLLGYVRAGTSPWPVELRRALRDQQRARLRALLTRPGRELASYRRSA